jgi:hypothetical protein
VSHGAGHRRNADLAVTLVETTVLILGLVPGLLALTLLALPWRLNCLHRFCLQTSLGVSRAAFFALARRLSSAHIVNDCGGIARPFSPFNDIFRPFSRLCFDFDHDSTRYGKLSVKTLAALCFSYRATGSRRANRKPTGTGAAFLQQVHSRLVGPQQIPWRRRELFG